MTKNLTFGSWLNANPDARVMDGDWTTWTASALLRDCAAQNDGAYLATPCVIDRGVLLADVSWDEFWELCEAATLVIMVPGKSSKREATARLQALGTEIQARHAAGKTPTGE